MGTSKSKNLKVQKQKSVGRLPNWLEKLCKWTSKKFSQLVVVGNEDKISPTNWTSQTKKNHLFYASFGGRLTDLVRHNHWQTRSVCITLQEKNQFSTQPLTHLFEAEIGGQSKQKAELVSSSETELLLLWSNWNQSKSCFNLFYSFIHSFSWHSFSLICRRRRNPIDT